MCIMSNCVKYNRTRTKFTTSTTCKYVKPVNVNLLQNSYLLYYVVDVSSSERLLGVTINNDFSWNTQVENVIHFFTYCLELKYFSLFKSEHGFTMLTFFPTLIFVALFRGNCTSVMEDKLVKLQKRAARAILDIEFTVLSETMFTQLDDISRTSCLP